MINCPRCGASNPADNRFCGKCGQVLSASGLLDHAPQPADDLPDWLKESTDDAGSSFSQAPVAGTPPASSQSELPDWLSETGSAQQRQAPSESAQAPDWLAQLQQNPPVSSGAEDVPGWLRGNDEPPTTSGPAPAASQQLPDWLRDLETPPAPSAMPPAASQAAPDWFQSSQPPAQAPTPSPATDQLPDWLRELETEPPAPAVSASAPAADELPAWLREEAPAQDQSSGQPNSRRKALPDWLAEFGVEDSAIPPSTSEAAPPPSTPSALPEVPNWLSEFETPIAPAASSPPIDDVPAWLREESPVIESPQRSAEAAQAQTPDLPDWLADGSSSDTGSQDLNLPLPDWSSEFGADLPPQVSQDHPHMDWLHTQEPPTAQSGATIPLTPASSSRPADELPDWLREIEQPDTSTPAPFPAASQDLPPWLIEPSPLPATPTAPPQSTSPADDLPPWLADERAAPGAPPQPTDPGTTQRLPAWLLDEPLSGSGTTPPLAQQALPPADDLPAWLGNNDEASASVTPGYTPPADDLPAWLSGGDAPSSGAPSLTSSADELPSWLSVDAPERSAQTFNPPSDELPSWLSVDAPERSAQTFNPPSDELPSWLSGGADEDTTPAASYTQSQSGDLPPWLATSDEPSSVPGAQTQGGDLPPWLATSDEPSSVSGAQTQGGDLPPWLATSDEPSSTPGAQTQSGDLPPWLSGGMDQPTTAGDTRQLAAQQPASIQPTSDDADVPSWLGNAAPAQTAPAASSSDADLPPWLAGIETEAPAKPAPASSGLPSWLDEPSSPTSPAKQATGQSEFLGGLDLPAWLHAESDAQQPIVPIKETAPDWLQKLTPESEEALPLQQAVVAQPRVTRTPERVESMRILEQMLSTPAPEPVPAPAKRRRSWVPLLLGLVVLLLVGAILFILLNNRLGFNFGAGAMPLAAIESAARTIDALPTQRPVMLAYEWDAQRLGDLRPLEEVVIAHLVARRDVPLMFVSTDPQGSLLAAERAGQISRIADNFHDQYGLGYVNLGYKAGGAIALRRIAANRSLGALFAQDAGGNDLRANDVVMQSMCGTATADGCSWSNLGLLVVIADEVEDVRGWFEQVRAQQPDLPLLLLTTAEVAPQVEPYAASPGTQMLAGAAAAESYNRIRGVHDERLGRQADATAVGSALFALLIVVGGPIAAFRGYRTRREAEVEEWRQ